MNRKLHAFWIIPALAVGLVWFTASAGAQVESAQAPDIIFVNGKVVTVNQDFEVVEALHQKFAGTSGTYRFEKDTLFFEPIVSATPGHADRRPRRQFELNEEGTQLILWGTMSRGHVVREVWEKVQDFD